MSQSLVSVTDAKALDQAGKYNNARGQLLDAVGEFAFKRARFTIA